MGQHLFLNIILSNFTFWGNRKLTREHIAQVFLGQFALNLLIKGLWYPGFLRIVWKESVFFSNDMLGSCDNVDPYSSSGCRQILTFKNPNQVSKQGLEFQSSDDAPSFDSS